MHAEATLEKFEGWEAPVHTFHMPELKQSAYSHMSDQNAAMQYIKSAIGYFSQC